MKINQTGENKGFAFLTFDSTEGRDRIFSEFFGLPVIRLGITV